MQLFLTLIRQVIPTFWIEKYYGLAGLRYAAPARVITAYYFPQELRLPIHCHRKYGVRLTPAVTPISKLPIAKTLRNSQKLAKRKTYLRKLAKLVFAKACENSYLRNLENLAKQT